MNRRLFPTVLAAALLALVGCTGHDAVNPTAGGDFHFVSASRIGSVYPPGDRKKAGDLTGELLNGASISLAQQRGKVVVVNYWATWCIPCQTETPQFDSVYRAYKSKGVRFIGVDTKNAPESAVRTWVSNNHISYPIVYDEPGRTALQLGSGLPIESLPFTVLVDRSGRVAAVYLGTVSPKDLEPVLNTLLAEHAASK